MYIEKKKIKNKEYIYLKSSFRIKDKVRTKTIAYLGKAPMSEKSIKKKIAQIKLNVNKEFLNQKKLDNILLLKKDFSKKLKNLNQKLIEDMFKDFKTFYIYNTNMIEGNTLSLQETNLLLNENTSPSGHDLREIYDHLNGRDTFDFIIKNKPLINKNTIIKIHSMLLNKIDKRIGSFRLHNVRVFGSNFETSPAKYVKDDIDLLLRWYNRNKNSLHPLILTAIFHEKFERIHPFYDGNGRTGRMISNLILIQNNLPPLIIENKKRKKYYEVLSIAHKANLMSEDLKLYKPIVIFFYKEMIFSYKKIFSKWG
jgi:Fic family protein